MRTAIALAFASLVAACSPEGEGRPAEDTATATEEIPVRRLEGTPDGGLTDWVADMKAGLDTVVTVAARDRAGAQRAVLDAYVNRQEWLERYYGRYGSLQEDTTSALGDAVMDTEARFHDLLTLVSSETVDTTQLAGAVAAVNVELDRVLEEAGRTEVPPVPAREGTE